ncbi:hypothetical protein ACQP1W_02245 [Spirillospora sp. CA-255316]
MKFEQVAASEPTSQGTGPAEVPADGSLDLTEFDPLDPLDPVERLEVVSERLNSCLDQVADRLTADLADFAAFAAQNEDAWPATSVVPPDPRVQFDPARFRSGSQG